MSPVFLTADWRWLVMLNFSIEPHKLQKYTPRGTEVDQWNGTTYISLVAFSFLDTKVKGMSIRCTKTLRRSIYDSTCDHEARMAGVAAWCLFAKSYQSELLP